MSPSTQPGITTDPSKHTEGTQPECQEMLLFHSCSLTEQSFNLCFGKPLCLILLGLNLTEYWSHRAPTGDLPGTYLLPLLILVRCPATGCLGASV